MANRWVWLVGGGPMQRNACQILKSLNYKIFITDANSDFACKEFADKFEIIDTYDIDGHLILIDQLKNSGIEIAAVNCIATDCHETVAFISAKLNLSGISPELSRAIGNKAEVRKRLSELSFRQPEFHSRVEVEKDPDLVRSMISKYGAVVVKPIGLSASKGIRIIENTDLQEISNILQLAIENSRNGEYVVEEKLVGDGLLASEASLESIVVDGVVKFYNMVDRIFGQDLKVLPIETGIEYLNTGVEYGHLNPSSRSMAEINKVIEQLQSFIESLARNGVYAGESFVLKADVYFSADGPVILECTPRTSGGWDSSYSSLIRGLTIQEVAIKLSLGESLIPEDFEPTDTQAGFVAVISDVTEKSVDCLGRTFTGSDVKPTVSEALKDAITKKKSGEYLK